MAANNQEPGTDASIFTALLELKRKIKTVAKDSENKFEKYNYASVDEFYEMFRPLSVLAGIMVDQNEVECELVVGQNKQGQQSSALRFKYEFTFVHSSGETHGPFMRTTYVNQATAQSCGAAQSYAKKYFLRNYFEIKTGEDDDADLQTGGVVPAASNTEADLQDEANRIKRAISNAKTLEGLDTAMAGAGLALERIKERSERAYDYLMKFEQKRRDQLYLYNESDKEPKKPTKGS